jgi:hypothetical protein
VKLVKLLQLSPPFGGGGAVIEPPASDPGSVTLFAEATTASLDAEALGTVTLEADH